MNDYSLGNTRRFSVGFTAIVTTLLLWLGACTIVDGVMMPTMAASGMTEQPEFAVVGYRFFSAFNRCELFAAAVAVVGALAAWKQRALQGWLARLSLGLAGSLLAIAWIDTYLLAPQMSGLSLNLSVLSAVTSPPLFPFSPDMMLLQGAYWGLESLKLAMALGMVALCWRSLALPSNRLAD
ncbi:MAG: hypothetical protein AAFY57_05610 [Cyanobacteria bacterium J06642_2]